MIINRVWAMPDKHTFSIKPIRDLISRTMDKNPGDWFDPFARNSPFNIRCKYTNDLAIDAETTHRAEALDFMNQLQGSFVGVLFDPPYSPRQISECYKSVGMSVHMSDTQSSFYTKRKTAAARLIKQGGIAISCGWNSGGFEKKNGFEIEEILIVPHGGARSDTIVTVERKRFTDLFAP